MTDTPQIDARQTHTLLAALGEHLAPGDEQFTIVVIGGSALLALGLVTRTTRDVDVVAVLDGEELIPATPLPAALLEAADLVAADFGLPTDWLNAGPASLFDLGLPIGFLARTQHRDYGPALAVLFASRLDQIHFKLYAVVDQGAGRHLADLHSLQPTGVELLQAARWTRTHDPSDGYRGVLIEVLDHFGAEHGPDDI